MGNNLLIIGAGVYGQVAKEIAESTDCYDKIDFIDDGKSVTVAGNKVVGTTNSIKGLENEYNSICVAIGNPDVRLNLLDKIEKETSIKVVSLVSPFAYVSKTSKVGKGCIIEPMAVVHSGCKLFQGCIISACAVVNHASICEKGVHVNCNATVAGYSTVPEKTKIACGQVFNNANPSNVEACFRKD